jgi:hypothetical protein
MRYEWDENKNERNLEKHGLSFETASLVFDDPNALSIPDRFLIPVIHLTGGIASRTVKNAGKPSA